MPRVCAYPGCRNDTNTSGISLFSFPLRDPDRLLQWERVLGCGTVDAGTARRCGVCDIHFPRCFIATNQRRKVLIGMAVPDSPPTTAATRMTIETLPIMDEYDYQQHGQSDGEEAREEEVEMDEDDGYIDYDVEIDAEEVMVDEYVIPNAVADTRPDCGRVDVDALRPVERQPSPVTEAQLPQFEPKMPSTPSTESAAVVEPPVNPVKPTRVENGLQNKPPAKLPPNSADQLQQQQQQTTTAIDAADCSPAVSLPQSAPSAKRPRIEVEPQPEATVMNTAKTEQSAKDQQKPQQPSAANGSSTPGDAGQCQLSSQAKVISVRGVDHVQMPMYVYEAEQKMMRDELQYWKNIVLGFKERLDDVEF